MRDINYFAIHCSGTPEGRYCDAETIRGWHVNERGWSDIGYHYVIKLDGTIEQGRKEFVVGAHVYGYNKDSIGICYVGGKDRGNNEAKDTRTEEQKEAIECLLKDLRVKYPDAKIWGHRDFSKDTNGDGVIGPFEWMKSCPSYDVKSEHECI